MNSIKNAALPQLSKLNDKGQLECIVCKSVSKDKFQFLKHLKEDKHVKTVELLKEKKKKQSSQLQTEDKQVIEKQMQDEQEEIKTQSQPSPILNQTKQYEQIMQEEAQIKQNSLKRKPEQEINTREFDAEGFLIPKTRILHVEENKEKNLESQKRMEQEREDIKQLKKEVEQEIQEAKQIKKLVNQRKIQQIEYIPDDQFQQHLIEQKEEDDIEEIQEVRQTISNIRERLKQKKMQAQKMQNN